MRRCLVKPGGKPRKARTRLLHPRCGFRWNQLCPLRSKQIRKIEQEEFYFILLGICL